MVLLARKCRAYTGYSLLITHCVRFVKCAKRKVLSVCAGVTPAERLLKLYHEKWGQNVDPIFEELLY